MAASLWGCIRVSVASLLIAIFGVPRSMAVQVHVVTPEELQKATVARTQDRQRNIQSVQEFLSSERAQEALKRAHISPQRVSEAVPQLSDEELAQLASRASKAQADFAAGTLSDRDILLILVGVAVIILIIVAVR